MRISITAMVVLVLIIVADFNIKGRAKDADKADKKEEDKKAEAKNSLVSGPNDPANPMENPRRQLQSGFLVWLRSVGTSSNSQNIV
jgi:hypothetical protein